MSTACSAPTASTTSSERTDRKGPTAAAEVERLCRLAHTRTRVSQRAQSARGAAGGAEPLRAKTGNHTRMTGCLDERKSLTAGADRKRPECDGREQAQRRRVTPCGNFFYCSLTSLGATALPLSVMSPAARKRAEDSAVSGAGPFGSAYDSTRHKATSCSPASRSSPTWRSRR